MPGYYPFLNSERDRLKSLDVRIEDIADSPIYSKALENAAKDILGMASEPGDRDLAIVEFTLAKILLSIIGNPTLNERYAERKSSEFMQGLERESLPYLIKIARGDFGMDIKTEDSLRIHFIDFLSYKPDFLKLFQMDMLKGYVQVTKSQLAWILRGAIKERILKTIPERTRFPEALEKTAKGIKERAIRERRLPASRPRVGKLNEAALPPCIKNIINALETGTAGHNAHFVLVTFLHGLGLDEESILQVFRRSPRFKEKTTRYQIRFSRERGYTCPACISIKEYGLCPANCPRKHPVSNYFLNLKKLRAEGRKK